MRLRDKWRRHRREASCEIGALLVAQRLGKVDHDWIASRSVRIIIQLFLKIVGRLSRDARDMGGRHPLAMHAMAGLAGGNGGIGGVYRRRGCRSCRQSKRRDSEKRSSCSQKEGGSG